MELTRTQLNEPSYRKLRRYTWIWSACIAAAALVFIFVVWLRAVQISDDGMSPTLRPGDVIIFDRLSKFFIAPRRGDIVAYNSTTDSSVCVGRVVALPGETIEITGGDVYINGNLLLEAAYLDEESPNFSSHTLLPQTYFIMPDNRADMLTDVNSLSVHADLIFGKAFIRVAPFGRVNLFVR